MLDWDAHLLKGTLLEIMNQIEDDEIIYPNMINHPIAKLTPHDYVNKRIIVRDY